MPDRHPLDILNEAARADPEAFWREVAAEHVPWFREPDRVFQADPPSFRWFEGGQTNMGWVAVDHQVALGRGAWPGGKRGAVGGGGPRSPPPMSAGAAGS
jgi:hypothetical protein